MLPEDEFSTLDLNRRRTLLADQLPWYLGEIARTAGLVSRNTLKQALPSAMSANDLVAVGTILKFLDPKLEHVESYRISPTSDLKGWCDKSGIICEVLQEAQTVKIAATSPYTQEATYATDPVRFASIPGGCWVVGRDFAIGTDGTILKDTGHWPISIARSGDPHFYVADIELIAQTAPEKSIYIDDDVFFLSGPVLHHFGHWIIDFLPRLRALNRYGKSNLKVATLESLSNIQRDTLSLCGVQPNDLISCKPRIQYKFRTLHVCQTGQSMPPNPENVDFVRSKLYHSGATSQPMQGAGARIFAARGKVGTRNIENADEVSRLLAEEGFIQVDFARLSVAEQQEVMANARIVIGVYGSNLFALYYAPPGCTVIALMPPGHDDPTIMHTCYMLQMRHQFLQCEAALVTEAKKWKVDTDIRVDCQELRRRLRELS